MTAMRTAWDTSLRDSVEILVFNLLVPLPEYSGRDFLGCLAISAGYFNVLPLARQFNPAVSYMTCETRRVQHTTREWTRREMIKQIDRASSWFVCLFAH